MAAFLIYVHPRFFTGFSGKDRTMVFLIYLFNSLVLPLLVVVLCKLLGFAGSLYLRTQKERIIPYVACIIFFFWTFYVFRNKAGTPVVLAEMSLGIFLAASLSFIANAFFKISMHATAIGGAIGLFIALLYNATPYVALPLAVAILAGGLVCTARLLVSDHTPFEVYSGLFTGFVTQLAAAQLI